MALAICEPCKRGDHGVCSPVPVARDHHTGEALTTKPGFVDCRCVCEQTMDRTCDMLERAKKALRKNQHVEALFHINAARVLVRARLGKEKRR
jgi:hypothetical protein